MMKRFSAAMFLLTLCAAGPAVRAQVLQIDADGTAHRIGPGWSKSTTSPQADATPAASTGYGKPVGAQQTLQLMLNTGSGRLLEYRGALPLQTARGYVVRNQERRSMFAGDEATLANKGYTHIRDVNYDPNAVIRLAGCVGFQTTVEFAAGERIENVGMGAASRWLLVPNKRADMLFIEPVAGLSHSNMTVVTDRHRYYFELAARDSHACRLGAVIYSLRLHYPVESAMPQTAGTQEGTGDGGARGRS
jgi:hypothetical protein